MIAPCTDEFGWVRQAAGGRRPPPLRGRQARARAAAGRNGGVRGAARHMRHRPCGGERRRRGLFPSGFRPVATKVGKKGDEARSLSLERSGFGPQRAHVSPHGRRHARARMPGRRQPPPARPLVWRGRRLLPWVMGGDPRSDRSVRGARFRLPGRLAAWATRRRRCTWCWQ